MEISKKHKGKCIFFGVMLIEINIFIQQKLLESISLIYQPTTLHLINGCWWAATHAYYSLVVSNSVVQNINVSQLNYLSPCCYIHVKPSFCHPHSTTKLTLYLQDKLPWVRIYSNLSCMTLLKMLLNFIVHLSYRISNHRYAANMSLRHLISLTYLYYL